MVTQEALETFKTTMTSTPVLVMSNFSKPFMIEIDANGKGIVVFRKGTPLLT